MKKDKSVKDDKPVYIICPRCEINYIDKRDKLCAVCKAELGIGDPSILLPEETIEQSDRICPVCHVNLLGEDEEICFECKKEREAKAKEVEEITDIDDEDATWEPFADDEDEEIPEGMQEILIDEDEEEEDEEEVESVYDEPDDFDYDVDPNDFEEDDEDEDDDL